MTHAVFPNCSYEKFIAEDPEGDDVTYPPECAELLCYLISRCVDLIRMVPHSGCKLVKAFDIILSKVTNVAQLEHRRGSLISGRQTHVHRT